MRPTGPADLDAEVKLNGVKYKTVFRMLRERTHEKTIAECEKFCDIPVGTIARLAKEFAAAKRPVIEMFRGPIQQSNGWYNGQALITLNMMMDNIDRKGGYIPGHKAYSGSVGGPKREPKGVPIDRHKTKYQGKKATSTRPFYPLAIRTVTTEFFAGVKTGYPYRTKVYLNYYNDPAYTQPLNWTITEALVDLKAMPLTFSIDAYMGETTLLCDYVLPDTEYLERFGGFKTYPPVKTQVQGLRQPVIGTLDPKTKSYRGIHPDVQTADDTLIQLAMRCGLPGFGKDGGGPGKDIFTSWQFWNEFYKNGDFKGEPGLDPNSRLVKLGGKFENPGKQYEGDYTRFPGRPPGTRAVCLCRERGGEQEQHDRQVLRRIAAVPVHHRLQGERDRSGHLEGISVAAAHAQGCLAHTDAHHEQSVAGLDQAAELRGDQSGRCAENGRCHRRLGQGQVAVEQAHPVRGNVDGRRLVQDAGARHEPHPSGRVLREQLLRTLGRRRQGVGGGRQAAVLRQAHRRRLQRESALHGRPGSARPHPDRSL